MAAIKTVFVLAALLAFLFAMGTAPSYACECVQRTPEEHFDQAAAVFAGRVTGIEGDEGGYRVTFDVSQYWKGLSENDRFVVAQLDSLDGNVCGYPFQEGEEYLTYALRSDDQLRIGDCTGSIPMTSADATIASLGTGAAPIKTTLDNVIFVDPGDVTAPDAGIGGAVPAIIAATIAGLGIGVAVLIIRKPKINT